MADGCVSSIIPCHNTARWIAEAVDSCLAQTHAPVEIIVVDDGSTDNSVEILQSYGDRIRLVQQPHSGGNRARNHGFALCQGEYIQFLDADDYILPDKIARQVAFLEGTDADVVYGDWRHRFHEPDGRDFLGEVQVANAHDDLLNSLLAGWWVSPAALLYRRQAVIASGGWDESLSAAQDRDFLLSVALAGADIRYQPGCHAIYRRYGNTTVSTSNQVRWLESHERVLRKAEQALVDKHRLSSDYRSSLAASYFALAHVWYDLDSTHHRELLDKTLELCPHFSPDKPLAYRLIRDLLGLHMAEHAGSVKRRLIRQIRIPIMEPTWRP